MKRFLIPACLLIAFSSGILLYQPIRKQYKTYLKSKNKSEYRLRDQINAPTKYRQVSCPKESLAISIFGQSNSANSVFPAEKIKAIKIPNNLFQFDWKSGKCYYFKEPLLGTTGKYSNAITYTAAKIATQLNKPVVISAFGVGATSVHEWAHGYLAIQHDLAMKRMKENKINPSFFLWHQGENDSRAEGVKPEFLVFEDYFKYPGDFSDGGPLRIGNPDRYTDSLKSIIKRTLNQFPNSQFGVALVSRYGGRTREWESLRSAQRKAVNESPRTFISADSDKIYGKTLRRDGSHFTDEGSIILGEMYYQSIKEHSKIFLPLDKQLNRNIHH